MRTKIFSLLVLGSFIIPLSGLFYTQVIRHEKYRVMSEENRLEVIPLMAPRGRIFDRNGKTLVEDVLCFNASLIYGQIKDMDRVKDIMISVIGIPPDQVSAVVKKSRMEAYSPVCVAEDIGIEKAVRMEEFAMDCPGLILELSAKRKYKYGELASGVLGYIGYINRAELERLRPYGYKIYDLIGRSGVEKYYDNYLRGRHGGRQVEVDYRGQKVTTLGFKEPTPGKDIYLSIDLDLQQFCDDLLKARKGCIVVMEAHTGEILAMSSAPSYDPNVFIDRASSRTINDLLNDVNYPMLNRAISGTYPPGSVFKAVIATAGLETGVVTRDSVFECPGYLNLGGARFGCWRKEGHGAQWVAEAIKNSCNVYFYNLGLRLGPERITEFSDIFGFGTRTGIDLAGENKGTLPSLEWKTKQFNDKWYKGDTVNFSIGQGYLLCTPLQVARMMAVFANKGFLVTPHIVSKVGNVPENTQRGCDLEISEKTLDVVREGLRKAVNDPRATGQKAAQKDIVIAGKTGTAQSSKGRNHGWFAGFAPYNAPKLVVVVFDEYGGRGGYFAAEIAGRIFSKSKELGLL